MARHPLHLRLFLLCTLALALAGCGGSDSPEAPPAQQVEATVGPAGAELTVQELALSVPPNALPRALAVSVRRETPAADEIARYTIAPAGQALAAPTELRFERSGLPARAGMFWEVAGERWLVPTTRSGNVLSARLATLGYAAAAATAAGTRAHAFSANALARPLADANGNGASLVIQQLDCQAHAAQLGRRLERVDLVADMQLAVGIADDIVATEAACIALEVQILEQRSCDGLARSLSQAEAVFAKDLAEFNSIVTPLYAAKAFVELTGATCTGADPGRVDALVDSKFDQVLAVVQSQQLRGDFTTVSGMRQLSVVLAYKLPCQRLGLANTCKRLTDVILPNVVDAMRSAAFDQCRRTGFGFAVSQLHALGAETNNADSFLDVGRFGNATLEADLSYCTAPTLDLHVFDSVSGTPEELPDRAQTLQVLVGQGAYTTTTDVAVPRTGALTIGGQVKALQCADGTFSPAALVARINGVEVARRAVSGSEYTIGAPPLDLVVANALATAGLDAEKTNSFSVNIFREGGQCIEPIDANAQRTVFTAPFKMFEVRVNLPPAAPVELVMRGSVTVGFSGLDVNDSPDLVKPTRKETSLSLRGQLEERAGRLVMVSSTATGTIFETSASVRKFTAINPDSGRECTFEHRFDNEKTTELVVGTGQRNDVSLGLTKTELTADEFSVRSPTRLTFKSKATLQNQNGDCQKIDTSAPPDVNDTSQGADASINKLLSLTRSTAFRAPVVTAATGRRSVALSATASDSLPRNTSSTTVSQTGSITVTLTDEPK